MGNTCAPESTENKDEAVVNDTEKQEAVDEAQPSEKLTKIINTYQAENEKMKQELEDFKNKGEQDSIARNQQTQQNEKIMQELAAMKAMLEAKERALVKHRLEAALHSKATSMVTAQSVAKLLIAGKLEKFGRNRKTKSAKEKWVEIELHNCEHTQNGFERGYMMLTYSDTKDSQLSNRCHVIRVSGEDANVGDKIKGRSFLVEAMVGGVKKEMVFACENEKQKNEWVDACNGGFTQIEEEEMDMNESFFLKVEFSKEKLGIRVEERALESKEEDDLDEKEQTATDYTGTAKAKLEDKPNEAQTAEEAKTTEEVKPEDGGKGDQKPEDGDKGDQNAEIEVEDIGTASLETRDKPCELLVKLVTDKDLYATGLIENMVITAINDINMRGMLYDKQVDYITNTKKPFMLTFTGPKYLRKKAVQTTAYPGILEELVAADDNAVKSAFHELVKGTPFEKELDGSEDKLSTIAELLSNQRRLTAMLQNVTVQEAEL